MATIFNENTGEKITGSKVEEFTNEFNATGSLPSGFTFNSPTIETPVLDTPDLEAPTIDPIETPTLDTIPVVPESIGTTVDMVDSTPIESVTTTPQPVQVDETDGVTGLDPQLDTELAQLEQDKQNQINDTFDSFNIAKGQFEENKNFYTNFDDVNTTFDNILNDIQTIQQGQDNQELSEEQMQELANKYGVDVADIQNPTNIFNQLELTPEGEAKFGVDSFQQGLDDQALQLERNKEDLALQVSQAKEDYVKQIVELEVQLQETLEVAQAQGVWSGAFKSSGYQKGLDNIKRDGEKQIAKIETAIERLDNASDTTLSRMIEDYQTSISRSAEQLNQSLTNIKIDNGLDLNNAVASFDTSSPELTNALNKIQETFATDSLQVYNDYLDTVEKINQNTADELALSQEVIDAKAEKTTQRFNQYLDNSGQLLQNSSLNDLAKQVNNGTLTRQGFDDLQSIMTSSIQQTLGKVATLNSADLSTISSLLAQGKTPSEIVAQMQELPKFQTTAPVGQTPDFGFTKVSEGTIAVTDPNTGEVRFEAIEKTVPTTGTVSPTITSTGSGTVTQNYGDTSPLAIDNVTLANGTVGTPGIDIDGAIGDSINAFVGGTVISAKEVPGYGNQVIIEDTQGVKHMYNHLDGFNVTAGDTLTQGQQLGTMGNTGSVISETGDGSHLDYRVSDNGDTTLSGANWVDPSQYLGVKVEPQVSLSPLAQSIWDGNSVIGDFTSTQKATLISELKDAGYYELPTTGNSRFQDLKLQDRDDLVSFLNVIDRINTIEELTPDVDTGTLAGRLGGLGTSLGLSSDEFIELQQLTGKNLADFIKSISGAAVTEQEAARLSKLIPTVTMQDNEFDIALSNFKQEYQNLLDAKIKTFGFSDEQLLRQGLGLKTEETAQTTPPTNITESSLEEIDLFSNY